jgi:hypothetical protein
VCVFVCSFCVEEISPRMNKQEDPRMNLANAVVAGIVVRASSHKLCCCCCDDPRNWPRKIPIIVKPRN